MGCCAEDAEFDSDYDKFMKEFDNSEISFATYSFTTRAPPGRSPAGGAAAAARPPVQRACCLRDLGAMSAKVAKFRKIHRKFKYKNLPNFENSVR